MHRFAPDPIEYLVARRFPYHRAMERSLGLSGMIGGGTATDEWAGQLREVEEYRAALKSKTPEELSALLEKERANEVQASLDTAEREEQNRFFNKPLANADFGHWSKAVYWTLDEALALAFGKSPDVVSWEKVQPLVNVSPFAREYARVRDLAIRAKNWQQLYDPVMPGIFLAWVRRTEIPAPEELIQAVEARGIVVGDWKDSYDKLKEQYDALLKDRDHVFAVCEKVAAQRNELQAHVGQLQEQAAAWQFDESADDYPAELDIAMQAWRSASKQRDPSLTVKQQVLAWLNKTYPKLSEEARDRVATVCNWEKRGGRRPQDQQ